MNNVDPSPLGERRSPLRLSPFRHRNLDHAGSVQNPALFLVIPGRPLVELPDLDIVTAFREACSEVHEHGEHAGPRLLTPRNDLRDAHAGYATAATARIGDASGDWPPLPGLPHNARNDSMLHHLGYGEQAHLKAGNCSTAGRRMARSSSRNQ